MSASVFESPGDFVSRLDFAALLNDNERLLKVRTALPDLALLPEHVVMREAVSAPFSKRKSPNCKRSTNGKRATST
jgi:hypothetical protein